MKTIIRLTESDLHRIIKESVSTALNEFVMLDANDRFFVPKGDDPSTWEKLRDLRAKRANDAIKKANETDDEFLKGLHNDDANVHMDAMFRNMRNAEELRGREQEKEASIGDEEYDDEYLMQFMKPYDPDEGMFSDDELNTEWYYENIDSLNPNEREVWARLYNKKQSEMEEKDGI